MPILVRVRAGRIWEHNHDYYQPINHISPKYIGGKIMVICFALSLIVLLSWAERYYQERNPIQVLGQFFISEPPFNLIDGNPRIEQKSRSEMFSEQFLKIYTDFDDTDEPLYKALDLHQQHV